MSERASFITRPEGVCDVCLDALSRALRCTKGIDWAWLIPHSGWDLDSPKALAGSFRMSAYGMAESDLRSMLSGLERRLCHDLDLVVIPEDFEEAGVGVVTIKVEG